MQSLVNYFASRNLDIRLFIQATGLTLVALLALAVIGRLVYGRRSTLTKAVSSAIGILFIYAVTVVLGYAGEDFQRFIAPLPFVQIENNYMHLYGFQGDYTVICLQVLSMIILSFLMNLADGCLPTGRNVIVWIFFRCLAVAVGMILHLIAGMLLLTYLPEGLITYAPAALLAILALLLLTGALKLIVGLWLTTVNPLIAALYTFFFANIIGKQVTKAVLTTGILTCLSLGLQELGVTKIYIGAAALEAYIPLLILLALLWYFVGRLLARKK